MCYKEKKKNVCKMKYHKDVVYKEKTKKVCKMNFNCQNCQHAHEEPRKKCSNSEEQFRRNIKDCEDWTSCATFLEYMNTIFLWNTRCGPA